MRNLTGRQVVTIVVAICAAVVLAPTAIWAAGASLVKITDGSGKVAQVDSNGRLLISSGNRTVKVNGTVLSTAATPNRPWDTVNGVDLSDANSQDILYAGTGGSYLNLSSFTAAADGSTAGSAHIFMYAYVNSDAGGTCYGQSGPVGNFAVGERFHIIVPVGQTTQLTYPVPLVLSQYAQVGKIYCIVLDTTGPSGYSVHVGANGFIS